jgi:fluoroacetyl-CoA thioesterase
MVIIPLEFGSPDRFNAFYAAKAAFDSRRGGHRPPEYLLIMGAKLDVGRSYQRQTRVEEWMTAEKAGNRGVDVLSTPMLLQLIEEAAIQCLAPMLGPNEVSLGSYIDLTHLAPTPVGFIVRTEVEVIGVNGRRVSFAVAAFDEREKIAEGTHERYVIDRSRFLANLEEKQT